VKRTQPKSSRKSITAKGITSGGWNLRPVAKLMRFALWLAVGLRKALAVLQSREVKDENLV
jgi:hypothetical protein